jgi:hypothetical protein
LYQLKELSAEIATPEELFRGFIVWWPSDP